MRIGTVIGRVTLSQCVPGINGARWLIVSPFGKGEIPADLSGPPRVGPEPSVVLYDDLGAGKGDVIGFVEGREAASPFDPPVPIDAISAAILDEINTFPEK